MIHLSLTKEESGLLHEFLKLLSDFQQNGVVTLSADKVAQTVLTYFGEYPLPLLELKVLKLESVKLKLLVAELEAELKVAEGLVKKRLPDWFQVMTHHAKSMEMCIGSDGSDPMLFVFNLPKMARDKDLGENYNYEKWELWIYVTIPEMTFHAALWDQELQFDLIDILADNNLVDFELKNADFPLDDYEAFIERVSYIVSQIPVYEKVINVIAEDGDEEA